MEKYESEWGQNQMTPQDHMQLHLWVKGLLGLCDLTLANPNILMF